MNLKDWILFSFVMAQGRREEKWQERSVMDRSFAQVLLGGGLSTQTEGWVRSQRDTAV